MRDTVVNFDQLLKKPLLKGELLWIRPSGGELHIGNPGEFANLDLVKKLSAKKDQFRIVFVVDEERVEKIGHQFKELKECSEEKIRYQIRNKILKQFFKSFSSTENGSSLDLIFISYTSFYQLPKNYENEYIEKNIVSFKRSTLIASIVSHLLLVCGFLEHQFLKETYNAILFAYFYRDCRSEGFNDGKLYEDLKNYSRNADFHYSVIKSIFDDEQPHTSDLYEVWKLIHGGVSKLTLNYCENDVGSILKEIVKSVDGSQRFKNLLAQEQLARAS